MEEKYLSVSGGANLFCYIFECLWKSYAGAGLCIYFHSGWKGPEDGAVSGKTGFTGNAGYCYVGAVERDGKFDLAGGLCSGITSKKKAFAHGSPT